MTDVEGSTLLWETHADVAGDVIERHDALIARAVSQHGGNLIKSKGEGDSTFSVFSGAGDALVTAVDIQRAMRREAWPSGVDLRVRAAIYTGEAELRDGDYHGAVLNRAARLRGTAHGGQVVCSQATRDTVDGLPGDVVVRDLGLHRLRDVARAEPVFQVDDGELPEDFPPLRSLGVRHNLPAPRTSFVGRAEDLVAVQRYLEAGRLVTLTGVGGCGKTRLALEAAAAQLARFPDGVFFVDLSPVSDAAVVAGAFASALGTPRLALGTGSGRPAGEVIDFLSTREILLVVDNCEHVIEAAAELVDEVLERGPRVSVLATSREALELQGEQLYPVALLGLSSNDGGMSDAVRLFVDRASTVRPGFVASSDAEDDIAEICRRLDGLPLAIELAAAQMANLSPREVVERLGDRLHVFRAGRGRAGRQRTLQAALDWSHDLLSEDERVVFRRLAVFPGSFTLDAALAVCGEPAGTDLLWSLARKSLLLAEEDQAERRYRLLETVRVHADARLIEAGERALVRDRHRDYFLYGLEAMAPERTYLDPGGLVRRELDNLRTALAWSEEQGRGDLVGRMASTMNAVWIGDIEQGQRWLEVGQEVVDDLDPEQRVRLLAVAAHVAVLGIRAGDGDLARRAVEAAQGQSGMWPSLAHSLLCLNTGLRGFVTKDPQCATEVERLGQAAVELASEPLSRGLAWFWLGQARVLLDDLDAAADALAKGSVVTIPGGDMSVASLALLAGVQHLRGDHEAAFAAAAEVLERAKAYPRGGFWAWALYTSLPYALELGWQGRHAEARTFTRELLDESGTLRTPGIMTSVLVVLGALAVLRGDVAEGHLILDYAGMAIFRDGVRTPVDIALFSHYLHALEGRVDVDTVRENHERANAMSLTEAIAYGLGVDAPMM